MFKKILIAILFVAVIGAGAFGTYHFYTENKTTLSTLANTQAQLAQKTSELDSIGTMTTVYSLASDVLSGAEIKAEDFVTVYIPTSAAPQACYYADATPTTDEEGNEVLDGTINAIYGKHYRCNYTKGTIITSDMLMTEDEEYAGVVAYPVELTFNSVPVTLQVGDYVDIRFLLSNGEEYVVLDHKVVQAITNNTIQLYINEEENAIINSLYSDLGVYGNVCTAYLFKYLEPGNKQTLAFYPVVADMEEFLLYNPNITDVTRCINKTLRDHIDQQLLILSDSANSGTSGSVIGYVTSSLSGQSSMRQAWLQEQQQKEQQEAQAAANGEVVAEDGAESEPVDTEVIE